ncbi:MAG: transglutaminase domain-containing protein [Lachnospiraceae bacterium]|nr:transglutaminase domain-containing protein [Lachnospiraceae bacterium]
MTKYERNKAKELDFSGVLVTDVYGTEKNSSLLLCLVKAAIIFLVCCGTVTGFCDAFSLPYNKPLIIAVSMLVSVIMSALYIRKKVFYIGYIVLLVLFAIELVRYYMYANSGFQAIMNTVREEYAAYFKMSYVRNAEEFYENRYITITITLIFIIIFLVMLLNITVSRYMNLAETFFIAFILLEIPWYIGYKPPIMSVIMIMAGCICVGILQHGAFIRMVVPSKNSSDYVADNIFGKKNYTTRGSVRGILNVIVFSLAAAVIIGTASIGVYDKPMGEVQQNSVKSLADDYVQIFVRNGIRGFFDRYNSVNGLYRGALGGVSSARPDFETDILVSFTPYYPETVYLRNYKGSDYSGSNWYNYCFVSARDGGINEILTGEVIDAYDEEYMRQLTEENPDSAIMEVSYVDNSFARNLLPYYTFPENVKSVTNPAFFELYKEDKSKIPGIRLTKQIGFTPYYPAKYDKNGEVEILPDLREIGKNDGIPFDYESYVRLVCTSVPAELNRYLAEFSSEHNYFGLNLKENIVSFEYDQKSAEEVNAFRLKAGEAIADMFAAEYPYTLSPGKTPSDEDFIRYFLSEQKKGYCSHFASAAVMLLRHMGIPARYVEGYSVPYALVLKSGRQLNEQNFEKWFSGHSEINKDKTAVSVAVSDYYAHAWVEVFLEGKGFVPIEVTPAGNEEVPEGGGFRFDDFFAKLMSVDLGIGNLAGDTITFTEEGGTVSDIPALGSGDIVFVPVIILLAAAALFWAFYLLIRYLIYLYRLKKLMKEERFESLVYIRYNELVKYFCKKKLVNEKNPLPLELAELEILKDYKEWFKYVEKVLYSTYKTNMAEYLEFYEKCREMKTAVRNYLKENKS